MARFSSLALLFVSLWAFASAWDINNSGDRRACQDPARVPLDGCDKSRTVFVSAVNPKAQFKTVQSG